MAVWRTRTPGEAGRRRGMRTGQRAVAGDRPAHATRRGPVRPHGGSGDRPARAAPPPHPGRAGQADVLRGTERDLRRRPARSPRSARTQTAPHRPAGQAAASDPPGGRRAQGSWSNTSPSTPRWGSSRRRSSSRCATCWPAPRNEPVRAHHARRTHGGAAGPGTAHRCQLTRAVRQAGRAVRRGRAHSADAAAQRLSFSAAHADWGLSRTSCIPERGAKSSATRVSDSRPTSG